jgi:hypothetical protein
LVNKLQLGVTVKLYSQNFYGQGSKGRAGLIEKGQMDRYSQDYSLIQNSFAYSANYWSSAENDNNNAWNFNFNNGNANNNMNNTKQVRATVHQSVSVWFCAVGAW